MQNIKDYFNSKNLVVSDFWLERYLTFIGLFSLPKTIKYKTELHHILPKSLFPEFKNYKGNEWNFVILEYRAHYIAHYMLYKAIGGKMSKAFYFMNRYNENKLNSILYNNFKVDFYKQISEYMLNNNPMKNKKISEKVSKALTGKKHKHSQITKDKMVKSSAKFWESEEGELLKIATSERMKGDNNTAKKEGVGEKITAKKTGMKYKVIKIRETLECPHCGKSGSSSQMKRYHFDNCEKVKIRETLECPHCGKSGSSSQMKQWHFDKCKFKIKENNEISALPFN